MSTISKKATLPVDLPNLPNNWRWVTIEDLVDPDRGVCYGIVQPGKHDPNGVPFVNSQNVGNGVVDDLIEFKVSNGLHEKYKRSTIRGGEVLLTLVGANFGQVAIAPERMQGFNCSRAIGILPILEDSDYVMFALRSPLSRHYMDIWANTTAQPTFNLKEVKSLPIPLPPPAIRFAIASFLSTLDEKIELNRRMNKTLESIAKAIFKSWFVDFDPVRAKLEGNTHEQQNSASEYTMPTEVYGLFPSAFQNSELGKIPEGWEALSFSDNVQILSGGTPKTKIEEYWNGEIPWYTVKDAPNSSDIWCIDTERAISQAGLDNSAAELFDVGISIISARGTVGKVALVGKTMAMNQSCYGIKGCNGFGDFFTYFNLLNAIGALQQRSHGSVFDTITRDTFNSLTTVYPTPELAQEFNDLVAPLLEMILGNVSESETLAQLRDSLLPKLLSGELTVPDALLQAEEVL